MAACFLVMVCFLLVSFGARAQDQSNSLGSANANVLDTTRLLDDFSDPSRWQVVTSNQVSGALRVVEGSSGKALCLDYDFNGVSGYAGLQRELSLQYPDNYRFDFQLQGHSPRNDLQFKLVDASGDNVWWVNTPRYDYPRAWSPVRYKKRHISKAWGPDPDRALRASAKLEFTIYNNAGGKGSVCFDELTFTRIPSEDRSPLMANASAWVANGSSFAGGNATDGNVATAWYADFAGRTTPQLTLDLGKLREFGGVKLAWKEGVFASDYLLQLSDDGAQWRDVRTVVAGNGGADHLSLPESEARYLRLVMAAGPGKTFGLAEVTVEPLEFAATANDFIRSVASQSPRGWYPRGFTGEQPYWTVVGLDGGYDHALIGEDGAVEVGKGRFSIEPFVVAEGQLLTWADVETSQSLQDGYLPIPTVRWKHKTFELGVTALVEGTAKRSQLVARYRLTNTGRSQRNYALALAIRPLQVNPPTQFLSTVGGFSSIRALGIREGRVTVDGQPVARASVQPVADLVTRFDSGDIVERLAQTQWSQVLDRTGTGGADFPGWESSTGTASDAQGLASGALVYRASLAPGESYHLDVFAGMTGANDRQDPEDPLDSADVLHKQVADSWRQKLDQVRFEVPTEGQALVDTLRTATAHMLMSREGPRLQPGTRSYARSWIRDGAMISEGLLRMGREEVVREYVDFYAPYQFENGMVPCCVDDRGSDPVPENDSHGELIFNIAELYRYDGNKAFLAKMWPHVLGAYEYMEQLRLSERTEANRAINPAFYGMMPVSISHEGYSAKPMHSYWDNFWALRGYKDAVEVAQWLGKTEYQQRFSRSRDQFRKDLNASLRAAATFHRIDFLPGAAELGDFDATSTTIALAPGGEQGRLPQDLLENTFERYWNEFVQRRDGMREWKDYTPYEWRNVAAFVRLGRRERAWQATQFFFKDRAPPAWNQWAEVVSRTPRKPFFVGDLPHAWVASDFVRSALDLFAYTREQDDSVVLAAGIPVEWLEGKGIAIAGLRTPHGQLGYSLRRTAGKLELQVAQGLQWPAGGLVLPWPYASQPGRARVDGKLVAWEGGELRLRSPALQVSIDAP